MNQDLCGNDYPLSIAFNLHVFNKTRFDSRLENIVKSQCQLSLIDDVCRNIEREAVARVPVLVPGWDWWQRARQHTVPVITSGMCSDVPCPVRDRSHTGQHTRWTQDSTGRKLSP